MSTPSTTPRPDLTTILPLSGVPFLVHGTTFAQQALEGLTRRALASNNDPETTKRMEAVVRDVLAHRDHLAEQVGDCHRASATLRASNLLYQAQIAGMRARMAGLVKFNPYTKDPACAEAWENGWRDADSFAGRVERATEETWAVPGTDAHAREMANDMAESEARYEASRAGTAGRTGV